MKQKKLPHYKPSRIQALNLPRIVCNHLIGEEHHVTHRMLVGLVIGFIGVEVARMSSTYHLFSIVFEGGGYVIHAIGTIPFVEWILKLKD